MEKNAQRPSLIFSPPSPELAATIERGLCLRGAPGLDRMFYELYPDPVAHLVLRLTPDSARLVLLGPKTEIVSSEIHEGADYHILRFRVAQTPLLHPVLRGVKPGELVNDFVELDALCGAPLDQLAEQLLALPDALARSRWLETRLRHAPPMVKDARCRQAAAFIDARDGVCQVSEIAQATGVHRRALERVFREEYGLSPKRVCRLLRLQRLLLRLRAGQSLAALAAEHGYADQAHMVHDLKDLLGRTPAQAREPRRAPADALGARLAHQYRP